VANMDVLGPVERRRVWSAEEKAALLAEIDAEGGRVRLVARRHGLSESLLYNWRAFLSERVWTFPPIRLPSATGSPCWRLGSENLVSITRKSPFTLRSVLL